MPHKPKPSSIENASGTGDREWPQEVRFILSALDAATQMLVEPDESVRAKYQVKAALQHFSDTDVQPPQLLYTREVDSHGLAFIGSHDLPLGYSAIVRLDSPEGRPVAVNCTVMHCRLVAPGWYEGALHFKHEQPEFLPTRINTLRTSRRKILIVDDDEQVSRLVRLVLETGGYLCSTATSGAQGCGRLAHEHFDLVITDLRMSCGDGFALIDQIHRTSGVPVIVISGYANDHSDRFRGLEIASILPKPIDIAGLLAHVRTCISRSTPSRNLQDGPYPTCAS